ncbi:amidohydrolase family protein [Saccharopolyspora sp. MS10]|uniref:amidohydrolase family protein n=1 Tax=Saccharopolyspora sp. MS10 TaxID=3385973 RepID=UPI0039A1061B
MWADRRLSCRACEDLADRMAAEGVAASAALLSGWRHVLGMLGPVRAEAIADRLRWLRHHEVSLPFGSDARFPISQRGNAVSTREIYEHIGVSHADIFELATTSARFLGFGEITGELRPGLDADVVVVDGDPIRDVRSCPPAACPGSRAHARGERLMVSRRRWAGIRGGPFR